MRMFKAHDSPCSTVMITRLYRNVLTTAPAALEGSPFIAVWKWRSWKPLWTPGSRTWTNTPKCLRSFLSPLAGWHGSYVPPLEEGHGLDWSNCSVKVREPQTLSGWMTSSGKSNQVDNRHSGGWGGVDSLLHISDVILCLWAWRAGMLRSAEHSHHRAGEIIPGARRGGWVHVWHLTPACFWWRVDLSQAAFPSSTEA